MHVFTSLCANCCFRHLNQVPMSVLSSWTLLSPKKSHYVLLSQVLWLVSHAHMDSFFMAFISILSVKTHFGYNPILCHCSDKERTTCSFLCSRVTLLCICEARFPSVHLQNWRGRRLFCQGVFKPCKF